MATLVKTTFQLKRGLAATWAGLNLVLAEGEPGYETDTGKLKIGNGLTAWLDLPYVGEGEVVSAPSKNDFPLFGITSALYKAEDEKKLYQWNSETAQYESLAEEILSVDQIVQQGSTHAVAGGAVYTAIEKVKTDIDNKKYLTETKASENYDKKTDSLNTSRLTQTEGDLIILRGGKASVICKN